jgi:hypothetical protein
MSNLDAMFSSDGKAALNEKQSKCALLLQITLQTYVCRLASIDHFLTGECRVVLA